MYTISFFDGLARQLPNTPSRPYCRRGVISLLMRCHEAWRQKQHVEDLPDYLLDDIGLTRGDLKRFRGWL